MFQAPALYPWRSVAANVALPLEIMGFDRAERRKRVERGLELVNLKGFGKKFPWQLSGGMQQRASIARALAFDPDLLLMDEPFGALDEIVRDMLNQQLLELWAKTGKTALFVTHSIPEAVFLSTRIVVMSPRPGRIHEVIDCDFSRASARSTSARRRSSWRSRIASGRACAKGIAMMSEGMQRRHGRACPGHPRRGETRCFRISAGAMQDDAQRTDATRRGCPGQARA